MKQLTNTVNFPIHGNSDKQTADWAGKFSPCEKYSYKSLSKHQTLNKDIFVPEGVR